MDNILLVSEEKLRKVIIDCIDTKLDHVVNPIKTKDLVTLDELSKELKKSRQTIYNWTKQGKIQSLKVGRSIFYDLSEVMEFIKSQKQ